jgi:transposase
MKQTFGRIPRSLIALERGTHSPWVSRLLTEIGHEVVVAHAQKAELITKTSRKDDRHDARTLSRLARVQLVSGRSASETAARGLVMSYCKRLPKCGRYLVDGSLWSSTIIKPRQQDYQTVLQAVDVLGQGMVSATFVIGLLGTLGLLWGARQR